MPTVTCLSHTEVLVVGLPQETSLLYDSRTGKLPGSVVPHRDPDAAFGPRRMILWGDQRLFAGNQNVGGLATTT